MPIIENIHPFLFKEDLYDAWLRQNPSYRKTLFDGKTRAEIQFRAYAKIWERVLVRVAQMHSAALTCEATGAINAFGTIEITWSQGTSEGFTIKAGQILVRTPWGVRYQTQQDLTIGASEAPGTTRTLGAVSEWSGIEPLVDGRDVNTFAIPLDLCDELAGILWDVGVTETAKQEFIDGIKAGEITVTGTTSFAGTIGSLDLIASGKGLPRAADESDKSLRRRLKRLPRTVTRQNIVDEVNDILAPFGAIGLMVEGFQGGLSVGEWVVGDDSTSSPRSFFIFITPNLDSLIEVGIVVDDWIVGETFVGDDTSVLDGILAAVDDVVQKSKLGGICAVVIHREAP